MQLTLFLIAAICSLSSFVACQDDYIYITGINSKQVSALSSYLSDFSNDPKFTSFSSVIATATATLDDSGETSALRAAATGSVKALPTIPTDLPKDAQSFISSAYAAEISVLTKYRSGNAAAAAPTGALMAAGAAAVGVMGFAAM